MRQSIRAAALINRREEGEPGRRRRLRAFAMVLAMLTFAALVYLAFNLSQTPPREQPSLSERGSFLAFSPDGKSLAQADPWKMNPRVRLWDVATRSERWTRELPSSGASTPFSLTFSPD